MQATELANMKKEHIDINLHCVSRNSAKITHNFCHDFSFDNFINIQAKLFCIPTLDLELMICP